MNFAIVIPTRDRRDFLCQLIEIIEEQMRKYGIKFDIYILNTGKYDYSNLKICAENIFYRHQYLDGYSSARNFLIDWVGSEYDYLIMLDDDEYPSDSWLPAIIDSAKKFNFLAAIGPILPDFGVYQGWKTDIKHYYHNFHGKKMQFVSNLSCGNLVINLARLEKKVSRPFFQEEFNLTGGEDFQFGKMILRNFGNDSILYLPDAKVFERVPNERLKISWMFQKHKNLGKIIFKSRSNYSLMKQFFLFSLTSISLLPRYFNESLVNFNRNLKSHILNLCLDYWKLYSYAKYLMLSLIHK